MKEHLCYNEIDVLGLLSGYRFFTSKGENLVGSEKRKDKKGRILRNGESQRADGRYVFVYSDKTGKQNFVYSWKLEAIDMLPQGKRKCLALREKEKEILKQLEYELIPQMAEMTVLDLVERYISLKTGVKYTTRKGYQTVINVLKAECGFSSRSIKSIKKSDAKEFLVYLQRVKGKSYSAIHSIRGVLRPAFQMATDDDMILKNPFEFPLASVIIDDSKAREAITKQQEKAFLNFIQSSSYYAKYYEAMYVLFHTGLRISEFVGLTMKDIDMKKRVINVNHQLQRQDDMKYIIVDTPKSKNGMRTIPMTDEVYNCFKKILKNRKKPRKEPVIDGYKGFLFLDKNNMPTVALHWEKYFQHAREHYNRIYKEELPDITPHVCRHTFCTNMAKAGMNPKSLQYLMGHSSIEITLDVYTHVKFEDAKEEWDRINDISPVVDLEENQELSEIIIE